MIFGWFDARAAQAFGSDLRAPSWRACRRMRMSERKFEMKAKSALTQLGRRIADFKREHRLNIYQKAKLGNSFKWVLKDAGYDSAYVDKLTDW